MTATPPAPTVTPYVDALPCPRVEVLITPMPGDATSVKVWRSVPGSAPRLVRGADRAAVSGDYLVMDYEAPIGVPVTYTCQTRNVTSTPSTTSSASAPVTLASPLMWVHDALDPAGAVGLSVAGESSPGLADGSFAALTYAAALSTARTGGAYPFAAASPRQAASDVPLVFWADGDGDTDALRIVLQAFPLCVRVPLAVRGPERLLYLALGDVVESPLGGGSPITTFTTSGIATLPPGLSIVLPVRTWNDGADEGTTWDDMAALYRTWLDAQRGGA